MKIIKFRAWIKHLQLMAEVMRINFDCETIECYLTDEQQEEGDLSEYSFDEIELMQFTGLKDKKGKEAFSGDVFDDDRGKRRSIFYAHGGFAFETFDGEFEAGNKMFPENFCNQNAGWFKDNCQIIGNIHENPELLEAK